MDNIIKATFSGCDRMVYTRNAYQYDYGQVLKIEGVELPQAYEVHFANSEWSGNSITQIGDANGCIIPDELFLTGLPVYAWTYLHTGTDDGETVYKAIIGVYKRAKPTNATPTPVQQDAITQAIAALDAAVEQTGQDVTDANAAKEAAELAQEKAEDAQTAAENAQGAAEEAQRLAEGARDDAQGYASDAAGSATQAEQAAQSILDLTADASVDANIGTPSVGVDVYAVGDHKNMSFSFHNLKGQPGNDGTSPTVTVENITDGHRVTITDKDGDHTFDVMDGEQGDPGDPGFSPVVVVTDITGGHEVEVVDAEGTQTFEVLDGEVSEEQLETALIDKADVIVSSASGEIVTISDGGDDMPMVDLKVSLLPVQSGSGDPSPDNVRPISGWTGVDIYHSNINLLPLQEFRDAITGSLSTLAYTTITNDYITISNGGNSVKSSASERVQLFKGKFKDGLRYRILIRLSSKQPSLWTVVYKDGTSTSLGQSFVSESDGKFYLSYNTTAGKDVAYLRMNRDQSVSITYYMDTVAILPYGTTLAEYKPYQGNTIPIDWSSIAGTLYGVDLDVTTGDLSKKLIDYDMGNLEWEYDSQYNRMSAYLTSADNSYGSARTQPFMCDIYKVIDDGRSISNVPDYSIYTAKTPAPENKVKAYVHDSRYTDAATFKTDMAGHQIVIKRIEPFHFQLSGIQMSASLGINNIWMNANGTLDLEYRADTKLYIENLTKPSEDDMTANANITSGSYFMVGNDLYLATANIAQGDTIAPGTNCTRLSLAQALNLLNA